AIEEVEQRPARGDEHLVLDLVGVLEVDEPATASVGAAAAEATAAASARAAAGAALRSALRLLPALRRAPLPRLELAAAELLPELREAGLIDFAVGPAQALEHLRRKRGELLVGDRRGGLPRPAAEPFAQFGHSGRVE